VKINIDLINKYYMQINEDSRNFLDDSIKKIVEAKKNNLKVVVVTGSGPNIHEGVTTLIAELMDKGIIDGVSTSSAVIAHEMGGVLDKVKRIDGKSLEKFVKKKDLPRGGIFELTEMSDEKWERISAQMLINEDLVTECKQADGQTIIKAAGNMAYPMGLYCESLSGEILDIARAYGIPFEEVAGWGADERTMLGAGVRNGLPVLVSVPQLVGGGAVGMAIGDSIPISQRSARIADMLGGASVIIESAVALTQEIHDGPFETFTGHGIWAMWMGYKTYSIEGKTLIRFDLDDNLRKAWEMDKKNGSIQEAINKGLPKTKMTKIPFRMEMSAFSRLDSSIPVIGDIGVIWPILAARVSQELGIELDFISHPQQTMEGKVMRDKLVNKIEPIDKRKIIDSSRQSTNFSVKKRK
jgi:hypothetical protein